MKPDGTSRPIRSRRIIVAAVVAVLLVGLVWSRTRQQIADDPRVIYLAPANGAHWIRVGKPASLGANGSTELIHEFRVRFTLSAPISNVQVSFKALTQAAVYLDGEHVYASSGDPKKWKELQSFTVARELEPGEHEIRFGVRNRDGAVALVAYSDELDLRTGDTWEAREGFTEDFALKGIEGTAWTQAARVETVIPTSLSQQFPTTFQAFLSCGPLLGLLFAAVVLVDWVAARGMGQGGRWKQIAAAPGTWRWILLVACAVLWINNIVKVPLNVGFDVDDHVEYIRYVSEHWSIPDARDGWQMFQSPLYYIVSAVVMQAFGSLVDEITMLRLLRVVPLLCGLAQIEICFRALKLVFPDRPDAQRLGLLVGGVMPMNLYLSNYVGNEPLAACFSSWVVLLAMGCLADPARVRSRKWQLTLGLALGLALLSKVTAVLLLLPVLVAVGYAARRAEDGFFPRAGVLLTVLAAAFVVCGWYYVGNWIRVGTPFLGGWDVERGIIWWQDPGYRTLRDFVSFSTSLVRPINAAFYGFWDGFYSTLWLDGHLSSVDQFDVKPPWNYSLLVSAPLLALLPTAAILLASTSGVWHPLRRARGALLFAGCCLAIYLAAMLQLFLLVPTYSTVKATYSLGILPCYAVLAAAGLDLLCCNRVLRMGVLGWVATFAAAAYGTYFAL